MKISIYDAYSKPSTSEIDHLTNFLFDNLEEKETKKKIRRSIQYSVKEIPGFGGYVFVLENDDKILGIIVINKTGMGDYIPENFLVYMTIHKEYQQSNISETLMTYVLKYCKGDISLHVKNTDHKVELFQNFGFEKTFLEMRLIR